MSVKKKFAYKSAFALLLMTTLTPLTIVEAKELKTGNHMEGNVGQNIRRSQADKAEEYWTPERMQNAQPLPLKRPGSPQPVSQPEPACGSEVSAPSSKPGEASQPDVELR